MVSYASARKTTINTAHGRVQIVFLLPLPRVLGFFFFFLGEGDEGNRPTRGWTHCAVIILYTRPHGGGVDAEIIIVNRNEIHSFVIRRVFPTMSRTTRSLTRIVFIDYAGRYIAKPFTVHRAGLCFFFFVSNFILRSHSQLHVQEIVQNKINTNI